MAQAADADNSNFLARTAAVLLEGRVEGYAAAEHGGCVCGGDGGGDLEDKVRGGAAVVGVTTVGLAAVGVLAVVGSDHIGAVVFGSVGAFFAVGLEAGGGLGADTDSIANPEVLVSVIGLLSMAKLT